MIKDAESFFNRPVTRRKALKALGVAAALGLMPSKGPSARASKGPPNILFILSDDHRWDALGCTGHPFIRTPNLDALLACVPR